MTIAVLGLVVGVLVVFALLSRFVLHGPVNAVSLYESVSREAGAPRRNDRCGKTADRRQWRCAVLRVEGSRAALYRVVVDTGGSCWRAVLANGGSEGIAMPRTLRGCVYRLQWRPDI